MIIEKFKITISKKTVFELMECSKDSSICDQVEEEYNILIREIYNYIEPKAGLIQGEIPKELFDPSTMESKEAIFALLTVGNKGGIFVSQLFHEGKYLAGMIADAMLDDYLFQMDILLKAYLIEMVSGKGICKRLEAPSGIDIKIQKTIHQALNAENTMGITIKESMMYEPLKSMSCVYLLSSKTGQFQTGHDCSQCDRKDCKYKKL